MKASISFGSEAEMVAKWVADLKARRGGDHWTVYAETAEWDLILVHSAGHQVGIEAKLGLNAKVLSQALKGSSSYWREDGPDYRAVLVPFDKCQLHISELARALGIVVLNAYPAERGVWRHIDLPDETGWSVEKWPHWCPAQRCTLPDYVPDVGAGHSSPLQLSLWKIKAIKLLILLERRGFVTRADMKALQISPTRWTDAWHGFLGRDQGRFIRCTRTPDLKSQHPTNWAEIEADYEKWCPPGYLIEAAA